MQVLTIDLELTPIKAHVWQLYGNQSIGLNQIQDSPKLLCAAFKWHGEDTIFFDRGPAFGGTLDRIWDFIDRADAVVTWNGDKFDIPHLKREFLYAGYGPPKPFESLDLLKTSRREFLFPSNKLDYVAGQLLGANKLPHTGHQLWVDCMAGDEAAWALMEKYNRRDVWLTDQLYPIFLPWIKKHPNMRLMDGHAGCPRCGSLNLPQKRGFRTTAISKFQQYQCQDCKGWFRDTKRLDGSSAY